MAQDRPRSSAGAGYSGRRSTEADSLDYLVDLVSELKTMAAHYKLYTLAGILSLAQVEAQQRRAELDRWDRL